jgi:hypothetical protein
VIGVTAATDAAPVNGRACCAQEQRGCKAICRGMDMKFDKAAFKAASACNPETCGDEIVDCEGFCV